ncbi:MAG: cell division protein SepF [Actinomycetia bacterium]|nr:cell division protein SepF [Actinomycetes bacterium]
MSMWENVKSKFGFGDEDYEAYDEYEAYEEPASGEHEDPGSGNSYAYESPYDSGASAGSVRMRPRTPDLERASAMTGSPLRSVPTGPASVSPMTPQVRIHNARPSSFEEVSVLADKFKAGTPVILDLTRVPAAQQRRFIDFASGLTYALDGGISKVADLIFMLTPQNVEMQDLDQRKFGSARTIF